jgi:hypothetical protein
LSKKTNLGFLQVLSTILIERLLDVAFAAGLLLCSLPFVVKASLAWQVAALAGGLVLTGLALLYLLAHNQNWAQRQFQKLTPRIPLLQRVFGQRQLLAFFSGLSALTEVRRFVRVVLLIFANWAIAVLQFYVLLRAFFPNAQPIWAIFTLGVMALGIAVPSSPGAVGVLEVSIMGALAPFDLDPSVALAAALTAHLTNYLLTGVIGAFALAQDGLTLSGLYKDVRNISPSDSDNPN